MRTDSDGRLHVLLVEDSPADAALVEAVLDQQAPGDFALEQVERLAAAKERLTRDGVDCVLFDLGLPDATGLSGLSELVATEPAAAIVVLTGDSDAATGVAALKAGAQDYLVKGAAGAEIARALRHAIERHRIEAENARFRAILGATTDFVGIVDAQGRTLDVNPAGRLMLGIGESEDISSMTIRDYVVPEAADRFMEALSAAIRDGVWRGETPFLHRDGHEIPTSQVVVVQKRKDGEVAFLATIARDISSERAASQRLRQLADHDALTGLLNRRRMEEELERHADRAARYGAEGALLLLDLDHFKYVNDTFGHHVGDSVLVGVATLLLVRLRASDTVARLGGDEFAVLLPKVGAREATGVARDLLATVRENVVVPSGERRRVTTSIGIALFDDDAITGEEALLNADLAMYEAKEAGRDRVALHSPGERRGNSARSRLTWADRIRGALAGDGFSLYVQPIRDARTEGVNRYELLLRLSEDGSDPISPGAFLPIAERLDLVQEIDRWVVARALETLGSEEHGGDASFHVNVSARSVGDPALVDLIEAGLHGHAVDPASLTFEVTETAALADMHSASLFASRLTELGCRLALDDFGTGFGSFYYLKHLPFDFLKIDGEFVRGCLASRTDRLVIEAVVGVARGLGKQTIAECVEDERTARFLQLGGIDYLQGFWVGRPEPPAAEPAANGTLASA